MSAEDAIYYDADADLGRLKGKTIAILGYGSQGHAHALNLRDSGCEVVVGLRAGSASRADAEREGLTVLDVGEAASEGDVVMILLPDQKQAEVWEADLFGEQGVLCGGATELVRAGFETLVEAGYDPRLAYFECLHELKLIVDLMYENGIQGMRHSISNTAEYGDMTRGRKVITAQTREAMRQLLADIQSGEFAKEWIAENRAGAENFQRMRDEAADHQVEQGGRELRKMMPWIEAHPDS